MPQIEEEFVRQALAIGLAAKIVALSTEIDLVIATFPALEGRRYLARLQDQRQALAHPTLRMVAAMVRTICLDEPDKAGVIAPAFSALALRHPSLSCFNATVQDLAARVDTPKSMRA